jgi:predicted NBD/HSP70 family sugar kinase
LQVTLQLLPLGSRLALDTIGAVEVQSEDPTSGRYRLKVLPFCVDVVNAAALRVEQERRKGHGGAQSDEQLIAALSGELADSEQPGSTAAPVSALGVHYGSELKEEAQQLAVDRSLTDIMDGFVRKAAVHGPQSVPEIAKTTGLPERTVLYTVDGLVAGGWVSAVPASTRQDQKFRLRDERGLAIGMNLAHDHVYSVLTDLRANQTSVEHRTLPDNSPQSVIQTASELVQELGSQAGFRQEVVGLGVALAGQVNGGTGAVLFAADLQASSPQWKNFPLEAELQEATGIRTVVENDANALAMYEYIKQGTDQTVAVALMSQSGEGIGSGFVINGDLAHGVGGVSGEVGHMIVDPGGRPCRCGNQGCLETIASAAAVLRSINAAVPVENLGEASALVQRGDQAATKAFAAAGEAFGRALASVTAIVGAPQIVIFGPPQLTREHDVASAQEFLGGVRHGHGFVLDAKVEIKAEILADVTLPVAAAATALRHFISKPTRWVPDIAAQLPFAGASPERYARIR